MLIDGALQLKWMQAMGGGVCEKALKLNYMCVKKLFLFFYSDFVLHQVTVAYEFLTGAENWETLVLKAPRPNNIKDII